MPAHSNPSLALAGAGAGALGLAGAGALAGAAALSGSLGYNENGNWNGNENSSSNASVNANENTNVNVSETHVSTTVCVDLGVSGELDLGPPSISDSNNLDVSDSIFIPDPGCGTVVAANNGGIASLYNGDVFNFGDGGGTQSVFDLTQANTLADMDALCGASVSADNVNFHSSMDGIGGGSSSIGDGIGSAGDVLHATTSIAGSADASATLSAFNQNIVMGANIQYNSATQSVIGGDHTTFGDSATGGLAHDQMSDV